MSDSYFGNAGWRTKTHFLEVEGSSDREREERRTKLMSNLEGDRKFSGSYVLWPVGKNTVYILGKGNNKPPLGVIRKSSVVFEKDRGILTERGLEALGGLVTVAYKKSSV